MRLLQFVKPLLGLAVLAGIVAGGYVSRNTWMPWLRPAKPESPTESVGEASTSAAKVILTDQAIANLNLTAEPLKAGPYWKTILVPGSVVDRPGFSDRGVVTPLTGVVNAIHHLPGETVGPGVPLFTIGILSESFHLAQSDLFKATQDIALAQKERRRLVPISGEGIAGVRLIEVENQIARLEVAVKASRQELQNRGLSTTQIDRIVEGKYVKEIEVSVPARPVVSAAEPTPRFEIQELKVELGYQVQAGQTLCLLANHQKLTIEGRAFPDETPFLERALKEGWPVEVDFQEPPGSGWEARDQNFPITHLANTIDPASRTFAFQLPLENESRVVEQGKRTQLLWRYRPGQMVRLRVKIGRLDNVFVLPSDAVARDGPEAFVFTQNVSTFERKPVRVLLQVRDRVVIANDGALATYVRDKETWTLSAIAQNAATQLNRMAKSQTSTVPKGYHVHADGSLHKNEDEGK